MFGNGKDMMSRPRFRLMSFFFALRDRFAPLDWKIDSFGIRSGDTVIDYGCGTGSCLRKASEAVGERGRVYAVDIHDLAIESAQRVSRKYALKNVDPVRADGFSVPLADGSADCIYALDMFHMVSDADLFLREVRRLTRPDGKLILEDGHQPRSKAKEKVLKTGLGG